MKKVRYISLGVKFLIVAAAALGIIFNFLHAEMDGYSSGAVRLLYFTNQSNIWVAAVALVMAIFEIKAAEGGRNFNTGAMYAVKLAVTVSMTLTGVLFCFILAPAAGSDYRAWSVGSVLVHAVVPILAVIDFFLDSSHMHFKWRHNLYSLIPPLYYLVLCAILYTLEVDFGRGDNFPYFFLNFGSPAGFFGFSDIFPYKIGTFYWLLIISVAVFATSVLYAFVYNRIHTRKNCEQ